MKEYYKDPKATAEVLDAEGWLYTGDMAMQDPEGFIYLVDRKKDVIITGGENLYPVQIEDFLRGHDAIDRGEIDLSEYDLSRWRLMHIGAQPVPPSLIRASARSPRR